MFVCKGLGIHKVSRGATVIDRRMGELGDANSISLAWDHRSDLTPSRRDRWQRLNTDAVVTVGISFAVFKMCLVLHPCLVLTFGYHYYWLVALRVRAAILKAHAQFPESDRLLGSKCGEGAFPVNICSEIRFGI